MSLRDAILKAVSSAISATGDIAEIVTYRRISTGTYNPSSGAIAHIETDYTIKAIISTGRSQVITTAPNVVETGGTGDLIMLFASADLPIVPDTNDVIERNSKIYKIRKIGSDPAGASYELIIGEIG
jgi:hypothetical protein